jgi:hypothetical protein
MGRAMNAVVSSAHEGIEEVRQGVASTEVALGVADEALNASDALLARADQGIDAAAARLGKAAHLGRAAVLGLGIAVAVGSGIMLAKRRKATQPGADNWTPEPASADENPS